MTLKPESTWKFGRRQALRGAALGSLGLAGAALIGCGSKKPASPTESKPAAGASTAAPGAATPAVKRGGRLQLMMNGDPPTFDMHTETTTLVNTPVSPLYNQLIRADPKFGVEKPDGMIPDLATSWEIARDGLAYTFKLAPNVKFHDGTPFSSADVKATIERNQNPPKGSTMPRQGQFAALSSMETPDTNTFVLKLSRPVSPLSLLPILGQGWMSVYSKKDIDGGFDYKKKTNGTGPFRMTAYERGSRLTFERNKDYFVKDRPYLDGLDLFIIPVAATQLASTQAGAIHVNTLASKADQDSLQKVMGDKADYLTEKGLGFVCINFNTQRRPGRTRESASRCHCSRTAPTQSRC